MKEALLLHAVGKRRILTQPGDWVLHVRFATFISFIDKEIFIDIAISQYCMVGSFAKHYIFVKQYMERMKYYIIFVKEDKEQLEPIQDVYEVSSVLYDIMFDVLTGVIKDHPMTEEDKQNGADKSEGPASN